MNILIAKNNAITYQETLLLATELHKAFDTTITLPNNLKCTRKTIIKDESFLVSDVFIAGYDNAETMKIIAGKVLAVSISSCQLSKEHRKTVDISLEIDYCDCKIYCLDEYDGNYNIEDALMRLPWLIKDCIDNA